MAYRKDDKHNIRVGQKAASTAFAVGEVLSANSSGFIIPATAATTTIVGICMQRVAADSSDYAQNTNITYDHPRPNDRFIMAATGATATQTMVGQTYDLSDSNTVNLAASTLNVVRVVGVINATTVEVQFTPGPEFTTAI